MTCLPVFGEPGTRVQHADGATGTITGTIRYITGHEVTKVRWDDGSSTRIGPVTPLPPELTSQDRQMLALVVRLICLAGDVSAVNPNATGGRSSEHPGGKQPSGGGMSGEDWWRAYLARGARVIQEATDVLGAVKGPTERPTGETPAQERARKAKRVMQLYDDGGWSTIDMASDTGLTVGQVNRVLADGVTGRSLTLREKARTAQVLHIAHSTPGVTVRHIASVTGIAKSTVQDILRRAA